MVVSIVFDGVAYAMILFIISVGLSVTMGMMGFVNLAHGVFAMAGGYFTVSAMTTLGIPFLLALPGAAVVVGIASLVLERLLYAPLYRAHELDQVLLSIGIVLMAAAAFTFVYGPNPVSIDVPDYLSGQLDAGFRTFPTYRVFLVLVGALLAFVLWYGVERTTIGARIRAAVNNRRMAESVGIDVDRLFRFTFALGSGVAALGGGLAVEVLGVNPNFAIQYLVLFLIVVSVGGLGSIAGSFVAATVLGISDMAGKYYFPEIGSFLIYFVMIGLLMWRPAGLFGRR